MSAAVPGQAPPAGIVPTLEELVALRRAAVGRHPPRRARSGSAGIAPSPVRGRGMEYAESREYSAGDDARHIDWRLTARTGRAHTKLYQAERERLTLLVADTSPLLYFGTRTRFKSVQAARAGAVAAWAALRDGDRVAALRGSVKEAPVVPPPGPHAALRVLDALRRWYTAPQEEDAGLGVALDHAHRLLRPGSRLLVLADVGSVLALPEARWPGLARHREVVVLLLVDPIEHSPPKTQLPLLSGGRRVELDLGSESVRTRWRQQLVAPVETALQRLTRSGIHAQPLSSEAASESWLGLFGAGGRR